MVLTKCSNSNVLKLSSIVLIVFLSWQLGMMFSNQNDIESNSKEINNIKVSRAVFENTMKYIVRDIGEMNSSLKEILKHQKSVN